MTYRLASTQTVPTETSITSTGATDVSAENTSAGESEHQESGVVVSLAAEPVGYIGSFPITNTLVMTAVSLGVLTFLAVMLSKKIQAVPRGLQNVAEALIEGALGLMDTVTGNRPESLRFFPLVFTFFIFILISNLFGLLPGVGSIMIDSTFNGGTHTVPLFRSVNADLNVTIALALISFFAIQTFGIITISAAKYAKKFINISKNPINTFVGLIELIGEFSKIISLSFRLFGNVFAGEVLLIVIAFLMPFVLPLPFMFIEIFVGFIQAFIFSILTLVFLKVATTEMEHG